MEHIPGNRRRGYTQAPFNVDTDEAILPTLILLRWIWKKKWTLLKRVSPNRVAAVRTL